MAQEPTWVDLAAVEQKLPDPVSVHRLHLHDMLQTTTIASLTAPESASPLCKAPGTLPPSQMGKSS